jgi:hypothetical protein
MPRDQVQMCETNGKAMRISIGIQPDDTLLVKGSRGLHMETLCHVCAGVTSSLKDKTFGSSVVF